MILENDNWYCSNICNYSKHDNWNNTLFKRQMPLVKRELVADIRPDIKLCNYSKNARGDRISHTYKLFDSTTNKIDLNLNLNPNSVDKDYKFCSKKMCISASNGKPYVLDYLRGIDIDSYIRGIPYKLSKCSSEKYNPLSCGNISDSNMENIDFNPKLVNINSIHYNPRQMDNIVNKQKYYCIDSSNDVLDNLFNNNTKAVYRKNQKYLNN